MLGSDDAAVDAEVIGTQADWYAALGLLPRLELHLNSIGDRPAARPTGTRWWPTSSRSRTSSPRTRARACDVNPLRVLDSKDERDQAIAKDAPKITDHLCEACAEHFASVRRFLDARGLPYVVDPALVRGLDYYERTAWEFAFPEGGSQAGSISGGGRYDGLAELSAASARRASASAAASSGSSWPSRTPAPSRRRQRSTSTWRSTRRTPARSCWPRWPSSAAGACVPRPTWPGAP